MAVYINTVDGFPQWPALPAAKITEYPLEPRDYRPFAQAQMALGPDGLHVRLTAFEADPPAQSSMIFLLRGDCGMLGAAFFPGGIQGVLSPDVLGPGRFHAVGGEDLQGIYWGTECVFSPDILRKAVGKIPAPGETLRGNVLKVCKGEQRHFGCLFPASPFYDLSLAGALGPGEMGGLLVVGY